MRIKKVSQTVPTSAQVVDGHSDSTTDSYSCNYVNNHSVVVSATEPTTDRAKVWLQYSRNLWNAGDITESSGTTYNINVLPNTEYSISFKKSRISGASIGNVQVFSFSKIFFYNSSNTLIYTIDSQQSDIYDLPAGTTIEYEKTFTTPANTSYVKFDLSNKNGDSQVNVLVSNIMLNEGSTALPYEPYAERRIKILIDDEYLTFM